MTSKTENRPTEKDPFEIARSLTGAVPVRIERFTTGLAHWVYDVGLADGSAIVVRVGIASQRDDFQGAMHWSKILRPLGVPLPELIAHGEHRGLPYLVLERLEGEDLCHVYPSLSFGERRAIAEEVCKIQRLVGTMPMGNGFGFVRIPGDPCHTPWSDVVEVSIVRSRTRIEAAGIVSLRWIDLVSANAKRFSEYFSRIRPTPFLDDVTTKNVLVHARRFSGIVDVDWVCFGDPLFTVGLTRTAILSAGANPDYTDHWCDLLDLTKEQRGAIRFYTALFCVDFMSEFGQVFNENSAPLDLKRLAVLEKILEENLKDVEF